MKKLLALALYLSLIFAFKCSDKNEYLYNATLPTKNGTIVGDVADNLTGAPINNAEITTQPITRLSRTDSSGNFKIDNVTPGTYQITATKIGYNSSTIIAKVAAGKEEIAHITLMQIMDKGTVYGKVTDYVTDSTLQNVTIMTEPNTYTIITDQSGNYLLSNIKAGYYVITASKEGYNNTKKGVHIYVGDSIEVNLSLGGGLTANPESLSFSITDWRYSVISGGTGIYSVEHLGPDRNLVDTYFSSSFLFVTPRHEFGQDVLLVKDGSFPVKTVKIKVTVY